MEKFGIFELLDTLSALTAANDGEKESGKESAGQGDPAFLAPGYPSADPLPGAERRPSPPQPSKEHDALSGFLARHDEIAKKAGK